MLDNNKFKGLRRQLSISLKEKGITNLNILKAIELVPRHFYMETGLETFAYEDKAFPIAANQTISQPYTVAFQTELLGLNKGQKVLEVGTGSGYQTSILLNLGYKVYTIERQLELYRRTSSLFKRTGDRPKKIIFGDGYNGYADAAPYDAILVTAGAHEVPRILMSQLKKMK